MNRALYTYLALMLLTGAIVTTGHDRFGDNVTCWWLALASGVAAVAHFHNAAHPEEENDDE